MAPACSRCGQEGWEDCRSGMPLDESISVVDIEGVDDETVHQGCRRKGEFPARREITVVFPAPFI